MNTHVSLIKLLIDAVVNGALALEEEKGRVRFELSGDACSVRGPLLARLDWIDAHGRPGLMSMINQVEFEGGGAVGGAGKAAAGARTVSSQIANAASTR